MSRIINDDILNNKSAKVFNSATGYHIKFLLHPDLLIRGNIRNTFIKGGGINNSFIKDQKIYSLNDKIKSPVYKVSGSPPKFKMI